MKKKKCSSCKDKLFIKHFSKNKARKDGLDTFCRKCRKIKNAEYRKSEKARKPNYEISISDGKGNINLTKTTKDTIAEIREGLRRKMKVYKGDEAMSLAESCGYVKPEPEKREFANYYLKGALE